MIKDCIYTFIISMVPVIELRGAIPVGVGLGLPVWIAFAVSIIGNFIPVPFILLFIRVILKWMKGTKHLDKIAAWIEERAEKNSAKVLRYASMGLFIFVAIPLPGTGAWTGALIAALLNMRMKYALPSIALGILCAGIIISLIYGGHFGFPASIQQIEKIKLYKKRGLI